MSSSRFVFALTALSVACSDPTPAAPTDASVPSDAADARVGDGGITSVPESESWIIPGMQREAHVLRTAGNVPHIYAANPEDLARVTGFVVARDRYFMLDLARRLAQGKLSALLGDAALETDLQSRQTGMTYVTEQLDMQLSETEGRRFDAFAQGINAYIEQVRGGLLAPPRCRATPRVRRSPSCAAQEPPRTSSIASRRCARFIRPTAGALNRAA